MSHSGYNYADAQLNLQRRIDQLTQSGLYQRYDGTTALRSYRGFWRANGSSIFVLLCMYATATGTAIAAFYSSQQRKSEEAVVLEQQRELAEERDRLRAQLARQHATLTSMQQELSSSREFRWWPVQQRLLHMMRPRAKEQAIQTPEQGATQGAAATYPGDSQASRSQEQQHTPSTRPEPSSSKSRDQLLIGPQPTRGFVI